VLTEVQRLEQEIANKVQLIEQATENITEWKADKKELSKALTVAKNIEKKAQAKSKPKATPKPKAKGKPKAKDPEKMTDAEKRLERMNESDKARAKAVNEARKEQRRIASLMEMSNMDEQKMLDHEKANETEMTAAENLMLKGIEVNKKNLEKEYLLVRLGEKDDNPVAVWDDDDDEAEAMVMKYDEAEAMVMKLCQNQEPVVDPVLKKNTGSRHNA